MRAPVDYDVRSDDQERRLRAKVHNERVKMRANALNAIGIAFVASAFIFPVIRDGDIAALLDWRTWTWAILGVGLHQYGLYYLGFMKSED